LGGPPCYNPPLLSRRSHLLSDLLARLNPEQLQAVTYTGGPLKIVAGAGTGKTGTLTCRFAYLVEQGTPADRILALTFSRRAATEFRERALRSLDASYRQLWIGTFHSFCLRVLREERGYFAAGRKAGTAEPAPASEGLETTSRTGGRVGVMGDAEMRRLVARAVREDASARSYYVGEAGAARLVEDAVTLIARTKDEGISLADFVEYADRRDVGRLRELAAVYLGYEELCRRLGKVDFGDLGALLVRAFEGDPDLLARWQGRFDHVMVDEFQDTNESQWRLLTLLAPPPDGRLTVVGDGAQAIYAFRGASPRYFERFTQEYPEAASIHLTTNYRSRQCILDVAHALIARNDTRHQHLICQDGDHGEPVRLASFPDEDAEADHVARSILRLTSREGLNQPDCAILCRSVRQLAAPLARALTAYGIPFHVRGYDPAIQEALEDLRAVLRCITGEAIWPDAARVLVRRQMALLHGAEGTPEDALARRYAGRLGPNQDLLRAVPPLDAITYGRVTDWLDGSESWRPLDEVRALVPEAAARDALRRLEEACVWLRTLSLETQVYAALALVGRLDATWAGSVEGRSGLSVCRRALRIAHGLARAGLGADEMLGELGRLTEEETELGDPKAGPGVPILTLHASKGLEWPAVFIVGVAAGLLPAPLRLDRAFDLDDLARYVREGRRRSVAEVAAVYEEEPERERAARFLAEERRLAYVGCTRARRYLSVTWAASYDRQEAQPSPFIADLQRADPATWVVDGDSRVMVPLDVARATRQQALAALGVGGRPVPPRHIGGADGAVVEGFSPQSPGGHTRDDGETDGGLKRLV